MKSKLLLATWSRRGRRHRAWQRIKLNCKLFSTFAVNRDDSGRFDAMHLDQVISGAFCAHLRRTGSRALSGVNDDVALERRLVFLQVDCEVVEPRFPVRLRVDADACSLSL